MNNLYKNYRNEKATLCSNNNCVTVFGETAKVVNTLAVISAVIILAALVAKAFR